jgi:hypothetical protein
MIAISLCCQIFFTGGGVSHYFGGTGNGFDFADTSLASYPASFTPISNAICMGSYTSGTISLPAGFTKICIGNGYFECSVSVQFIGQLQVYGFQTATAVSIPATIPACQVVGGGYQLTGVLTKSPCPPGQYSMGGVLACTPCARGTYSMQIIFRINLLVITSLWQASTLVCTAKPAVCRVVQVQFHY